MFAVAVLVLAASGISLFHTPRAEVLYAPRCMQIATKDGAMLSIVTVEVGNTGRRPQEDVKLRFLKTAMDRAMLPPDAQNFGVSDRPISISREGTTTILALGALEPEKRVTVRLLLRYRAGETPHTWEQLFLGIEPAAGKARKGDPAMTAVGRAWFTLFTDWLPF
jgi:hypothetical protein